MKEIPLPLIKTNQAGIVLFVLLAFLLQQPLLIYALFIIQLIPLAFGTKANLFAGLAKLFFSEERLRNAETQAAELAKFNQSIAVILLGIASVSQSLGWSWTAYLFAAMVACAALIAILGYCIGCTIYYQYKRWKLLRARKHP